MNMTQTVMMNIMQSSQQGTCCCAMVCQNKQMMAFLTYSHTQPSFEKRERHDNKQLEAYFCC